MPVQTSARLKELTTDLRKARKEGALSACEALVKHAPNFGLAELPKQRILEFADAYARNPRLYEKVLAVVDNALTQEAGLGRLRAQRVFSETATNPAFAKALVQADAVYKNPRYKFDALKIVLYASETAPRGEETQNAQRIAGIMEELFLTRQHAKGLKVLYAAMKTSSAVFSSSRDFLFNRRKTVAEKAAHAIETIARGRMHTGKRLLLMGLAERTGEQLGFLEKHLASDVQREWGLRNSTREEAMKEAAKHLNDAQLALFERLDTGFGEAWVRSALTIRNAKTPQEKTLALKFLTQLYGLKTRAAD